MVEDVLEYSKHGKFRYIVDHINMWPYQSFGNPGKLPVVFVHGFLGAGSDWQQVARTLTNEYYCICPDLPGHGGNTNLSRDRNMNISFYVEGLIDFLNVLEIEKIVLVGYSMGGRIALATAVSFPERVNLLVLESAHPGIEFENERNARAALDAERSANLVEIGIENFVDQWYQMGLFRTLQDHPLLLAALLEKRKENNPIWAAKVLREMSPGRQPSLWGRLGELEMAVMLVAGEHDQKYSNVLTQAGKIIANAMVKIVPQAGHNVHLEQPEYFVDLLKGFLEKNIN
ncbi:MAG: 2-succinyl-6-hydroxy-2,4-cyclohexadiene-1-carboxylate synthase [Anaerolineae bacterium]|nr:2-succinyl-6-hydroxy-2,4-cyclohexadiene-1-carboxylate synthase [Anaerolineae bacterium]